MEEPRFHWVDYVVFAGSLALSAAVGIYFAITGKRNTTEEFLMADRSMHPVPVAISLFVSWMSAISVLGDPVETYKFGAVYWMTGFGCSLAFPLVAHVFAPYYHKLKIISAYEFLETRYNKTLRLFATITSILTTMTWLGIVLFAPALALSQSSGLPVWVALVSIGVVCIFYTTLGGMKAVLWTDTLQMAIMVAGLLAILIQGCIKVGGVSQLFTLLSYTGHTKINNFDPSPFARATFWTFLIGSFFRAFNPYISTQMQIQRYCTVKTPKQASLAVYLNIPLFLCVVTLYTAIGLIMAGVYKDCDPLLAGRITHRDQMMPLLVLDLLGFMPGIPGLFMACVFSASLSSLSSGINSMSANTLKDFVEPALLALRKQSISDQTATFIAKLLVVVYGAAILALSFCMHSTGGSIFGMAAKMVGMTGSPVAGAFFVGVVSPSVKPKSVITAFIVSLAVCLWLGIGAFFVTPVVPPEALPISADLCDVSNKTDMVSYFHSSTVATVLNHTEFATAQRFSIQDLYYLNPLYYGALGCLLTVILSYAFHILTLCCDHGRKVDDVYHMEQVAENNGIPIQNNRAKNIDGKNDVMPLRSEIKSEYVF